MSIKKNIFYLSGSLTQRSIVLEKLKSKIKDSYETSIFDSDFCWEFVKQQILENTCLSKYKLVILNDWPETKKTRQVFLKDFISFLDNVPLSCFVVLNNLSIKSKKFFDKMDKIGHIHSYETSISRVDAMKKVHKFFSSKKQSIDESSVSIILDSLSIGDVCDIEKLILRLKSISHYVGEKKSLVIDDVLSVCYHSDDFVVWDFFNALDKKNMSESLFSLELLIGSSDDIEHNVVTTLYSLMWRYKLLLMVKECIFNKIKNKDILKEVLKISKLERVGKGKDLKISLNVKTKNDLPVPAYTEKMITTMVQNKEKEWCSLNFYTIEDLLMINTILVSVLIKVRAGCSEAEKKLMINLVIMVICGKIKEPLKHRVFSSRYFKKQRNYNV